MKHIFLVLITLAAFTAWSADANAEIATLSNNTHLRAGPDTDYPVIETVRQGERVELRGCESNLGWCEIRTIENEYGWIRASYLRLDRGGRSVTIIESKDNGGVRVTIFKYPDYWNTHYRGKSFYRHYGRDRNPVRPTRTPRPEKPSDPYKDQRYEEMKSQGYNPLCRAGRNDC